MPPPETGRAWSAERNQSFVNWINNGFPIGTPTLQQPVYGPAARVRKDVRDLSADEITALAGAFRDLMGRHPDDESSYFALAGLHGFPNSYCLHHQDLYNPWHRVYLRHFEDALRTVPGCAGVLTLPYWDVTSAPPDFLFQPPFNSYDVPVDIGSPDLFPGHPTTRQDAATIQQGMTDRDVSGAITQALRSPIWHDFNDFVNPGSIVAAHDGHLAIGGTMPMQEIAAFDPIFWFFHSNWERLWWEWQQIMQADHLVDLPQYDRQPERDRRDPWERCPFPASAALQRDQSVDGYAGRDHDRHRGYGHLLRTAARGGRPPRCRPADTPGLRQLRRGPADAGAGRPARIGPAERARPAGDPGQFRGGTQGRRRAPVGRVPPADQRNRCDNRRGAGDHRSTTNLHVAASAITAAISPSTSRWRGRAPSR